MERHVGQTRGRGSLKIWPRQRLRGPENEIYFYLTWAHELNLSSLYVGDDSTAKISTKKHFVIHIERNIIQIRGRGSFKIWPR